MQFLKIGDRCKVGKYVWKKKKEIFCFSMYVLSLKVMWPQFVFLSCRGRGGGILRFMIIVLIVKKKTPKLLSEIQSNIAISLLECEFVGSNIDRSEGCILLHHALAIFFLTSEWMYMFGHAIDCLVIPFTLYSVYISY